MMLYGDGCTGQRQEGLPDQHRRPAGLPRQREWKEKAEELLRIYEGNVTDGGLPAADLAAIAVGVEEMLDDRYIRSRVRQTEALGQMLLDAGVPIVTPPGSHAIFLDAKRFLPHIDQDEYPAQRLAAEIYRRDRACGPWSGATCPRVATPRPGRTTDPALELVRLTIPRRVYTDDHMRAVADGIIRLYEPAGEIKGLKFVYEPEKLRFFQGRFEPL